METVGLHIFVTGALLALVGWLYLLLLGAASLLYLLPQRWRPLALPLAPFYGWAVLVALGYPANAFLPYRLVAPLLGLLATLLILARLVSRLRLAGASRYQRDHRARRWKGWSVRRWVMGQRRRLTLWSRDRPRRRPGPTHVMGQRRRLTLWPTVLGGATVALALSLYARQGALSTLVADSDVEHFADAVAAMVAFPIGWSVAAQQGLEATPIGLAYHSIHASLVALSGRDAFLTAVPAGLLMLALAPSSVFVFARLALGLRSRGAVLAATLFTLGSLPLAVASFGWGQQTAAIATMPVALGTLYDALTHRSRRAVLSAGLLSALAAGSLYLATAPLVGGIAISLALGATARYLITQRRARPPEAAVSHTEHALAEAQSLRLKVSDDSRSRTSAALQPLFSLLVISLVVAGAGALSHLSAGAFLWQRLAEGLLRTDELAGRSTHVTTFASLPAMLGVVPLDLLRDATTLTGEPLLVWSPPAGSLLPVLASIAGGLLALLGAFAAVRRRPLLLAIAIPILAFEGYLRVLRPFPYGEFKWLTSIWFLLPCLIATGATWLTQARTTGGVAAAGRTLPPPAGEGGGGGSFLVVALIGVTAYSIGLLLTYGHSLALLAVPWGAALPEAEVSQLRQVVQAVPAGASVWVSNDLTPQAAVQWDGLPTEHRAGFVSRAAGATFLAKRWRGLATHLLAFEGSAPYGTVQRHSTELRQPVDPQRTEYVLLDATDDPGLYGLLDDDLVVAAGTLRLFHQPQRPLLRISAPFPGTPNGSTEVTFTGDHFVGSPLPAALSGADPLGAANQPSQPASLPPPVLPIGESFPGRRTGQVVAPLRPVPPLPNQRSRQGNVMLGLLARAESEVVVNSSTPGAGTAVLRRFVVGPGLTWYTTPALTWPATVTFQVASSAVAGAVGTALTAQAASGAAAPRLTGAEDTAPVQVLAVLAMPAGKQPPLPEDLTRSAAGTTTPLLLFSDAPSPDGTSLELHAWLAALEQHASAQAELRHSSQLWIAGKGTARTVFAMPGVSGWYTQITLPDLPTPPAAPSVPPGASAISRPVALPAGDWLWLSLGSRTEASVFDAPWLELSATGTTTPISARGAWAYSLPLLDADDPPTAAASSLSPGTATVSAMPDGTLVKGTSDHLYYVEHGRLRWVPSPDVLTAHHIPWQLTALPDTTLWRLPTGLPLE